MARLEKGIKEFKDLLIENNNLRVHRGRILDRLADGLKLQNYQDQFNIEDAKVIQLEKNLEDELEAVRKKHHPIIRRREIKRLEYLEAINRELLIDKKFEDIPYLKKEIEELSEAIKKTDAKLAKLK